MAPFLQSAALALRAITSTCPTKPVCPQDDGCTYLSNGASVQVNCATDYYGGDLRLTQTSTLTGCMKACAVTSNCVAASYVGQNCYMKSTLNAAQANENVVGVEVVSREAAPATSIPPVSATACPATYTCPENDGCTLSGANSQAFALSCGTDYYGGDLTSMWAGSLAVCAQACADNSQCVAASYVGGKGAGFCYLKDKNNGAGANENVDAVAIDTRVVPSPLATYSASLSTAVSSSVPASTEASSQFSSTSAILTSDVASSSSMASTSVFSSGILASSTSSSTSSVVSSTSLGTSSSTSSATSSTSSLTPTLSSSSATPTPIRTSTSAPVPTQVIVNGNFEGNGYTPWSLAGLALLYGTVTGQSTTNPHTGTYSFQATGAATNNIWLMDMWQTVTVMPGQAYDVSVWTKQAIYGNCGVTVNYNNTSVFNFKPSTSYTVNTGRISSDRTTSASAMFRVSVQCGAGGPAARLWLDDITMTQVQP